MVCKVFMSRVLFGNISNLEIGIREQKRFRLDPSASVLGSKGNLDPTWRGMRDLTFKTFF